MSSPPKLVQIGKHPPPASFGEKIYQAPIADKFFLSAVACGLFGMLYLGMHLWLMLTGHMRVWQSVHAARLLHASVQLYLFFGAIILGFIFQAAPKLLQVPRQISRAGTLLLVPLVGGVGSTHIFPGSGIGPILVFFAFAMAFLLLYPLLRTSRRESLLGMGVFFVISLGSFAASVFLNPEDKLQALLIFWTAVASAIFGASQQFMAGFLGGRRLTAAEGVACAVCVLAGAMGLGAHIRSGNGTGWGLFSACSVLSVVYFLVATRPSRPMQQVRLEPLHIAFLCAWGWAFLGGLLLLYGPEMADSVLHMWATGWGVTLIMAIMPRIIGFLGGRDVFRRRSLITVLLLWQSVPFARSLVAWSCLTLPASIAATVALVWWGSAMIRGIFRLLRRQWHMTSGRPMVQC